MKVAFTGAGGTGKTTLAKYLSEKWGLPYVGSVSREVMKEMQVESEDAQNAMTEGALLELQLAIADRRMSSLAPHASYVTDRCALDNYIYGLRRCGSALTEQHRKTWEEQAVKDLYSHDLVFYAPNGLFTAKPDGVRQSDIAHQSLMDLAMYGFLCSHAFDLMAGHVYILSMTDLDRRKGFCDALISEHISLED